MAKWHGTHTARPGTTAQAARDSNAAAKDTTAHHDTLTTAAREPIAITVNLPPNPRPKLQDQLLTPLGTLFVGLLLGWFAHTLTRRRDRLEREAERADRKVERDLASAERQKGREAERADRKVERDLASAERQKGREAERADRKVERDLATAERQKDRQLNRGERRADRIAEQRDRYVADFIERGYFNMRFLTRDKAREGMTTAGEFSALGRKAWLYLPDDLAKEMNDYTSAYFGALMHLADDKPMGQNFADFVPRLNILSERIRASIRNS